MALAYRPPFASGEGAAQRRMRGVDDALRLAVLAAPRDFDYRARRLAHPRPAPPLRRIHDLVIVADLPKAAVACTICRTAVRARVRGNIAHGDRARAAAARAPDGQQ